jgi:hypothetical protein
MRKFFVSALALGAILALATSGFALEKSQAQFSDQLGDWNAGSTTCSVQYYNICTGYIWVWSGWADGSIVGNGFDNCCGPEGQLDGSFFYYRTGGVPGYGFTGSAAVYAADGSDNPVGAAIASQAILPAAGWNFSTWGVNVPGRFLILHTVQDDLGLGTPVTIATDGAGGACGVCFPTTRTTNSYTYGTETAMIPPSPFNDGACFVELLTAAQMTCTVSVEDESWGSIKNLYR